MRQEAKRKAAAGGAATAKVRRILEGTPTAPTVDASTHNRNRRIRGGTTAHAIYRPGGLADRLRGHCDSCGGVGCYHCGHSGAGGRR